MGDHAKSAQPLDVFDDVSRLAAKWIWRLRQPDRDVVTARGGKLHGIDDEHSGAIPRRIRCARAVAVIREDDELKTRARSCRCDIIWRSGSIRTIGVDVERSGDFAGAGRTRPRRPMWQWKQQ